MRYRTPSRYELPVGPMKRALARLQEAGATGVAIVLRTLVEASVFSAFWGPCLRPITIAFIKSKLQVLEREFDAGYYVRQFKGRRRPKVERAPLLHYALIGWREHRSPAPGFDPIFYRHSNPALRTSSEPLLHYINRGAARRVPRNEVEGRHSALPWRSGRNAVLTIHHSRGGGSSHFLDLFEHDLWQRGSNILRLRAILNAPTLGAIEDDAENPGATDVFDLETERSRLVAFCHRRGVNRLMVNHLVDRPSAMMEWISELGRQLGCPYDVILHDYYALCPRLNLVDGRGRLCGVAPVETCLSCVEHYGSDVVEVEPRTFREDMLTFLRHAETVFVPSEDMAQRMAPHLSGNLRIWMPGSDDDLPPERPVVLQPESILRVAVLGGLSVPKGLNVLTSLARAARLKNAPLQFTLIGTSSRSALLTEEGVKVIGLYAPEDIDHLIEQESPHAVFLPAIWPETWSFVLTIALRHGLPVMAFNIGAPAERLRRLGRGRLLDVELAKCPEELLTALLELRSQWLGK